MRDESRCPVRSYCSFETTLDNKEVRKEVCTFCGKRVIYNKAEGERIDNAKYLRDHVRDFCQPYGPTAKVYEEVYGVAARKRHDSIVSMHAKKQDVHETFEEARDILRTMKNIG